MNSGSFEGRSNNGNFTEALNNAIETAKETMHTDFIKYQIEIISGEDGGFVLTHVLIVKIQAITAKNA